MLQNILTTLPVEGRQGRIARVAGSGCKKRSDLLGSSKPSTAEASKETGCRDSCISECCNNKLKSTNKLHWQYYTKNFDVSKCDEIIRKKRIINDKRIKKVQCVETGIIYDNSWDAYLKTGISHILECCKHQRKTAGKLHWEFLNE